ncbi:MAG: PIN domain-containing protein [Candidatus Woesearchaeota archaeon]|nr:PIN domain-containing protein [Candidatus Woesearchaeota archaeon]
MNKKYWFDTCIWRDFYEDRFSKAGNPLGKYASDAFMAVLKNKDNILFSESLVQELKKDYDEKDINDMLNLLFLAKVLTRVDIAKEEYLEAKKLAEERKIPFVDCLNAVQARNNKATMVSQDEHFTRNLSDIVKVMKPQSLS